MNLKSLLAGMAAATALVAGQASAEVLINGSFEDLETPFTGWILSNGLTILTEVEENNAGELYYATEGETFARLAAGQGGGVYTTLRQSFVLNQAGGISGDAAFLAFDFLPYDDDGYVRIFDAITETQAFFLSEPFAESVSSTDPFGYGSTPWTHFNVALLAGSYTIEIGVRNNGPANDNGFPSYMLVDNISVTSGAVPEPATWALMIGGFGMAGAMLRRRRLVPVAVKA